MELEELVKKINYYVKLSQERELTMIEKKDRERLRQKYLEYYKNNVKQNLAQIKIVDEMGNDVTNDKIKKLKKELRNKNEKQ